MSGTISLTLTGLQLFPAGSFVSVSASSVTGSFSFANFDGTDPSGQFTLTISGFQLSIGQAFLLTTNGNITITPDQSVIATIASATISSPDFSGLGQATVTNLQITQTGFSLGSLTLTSGPSPPALSNFLSFSSVTITFTNFSFAYSSSPTVSGTVSVAATNVVLFPSVSFLDVKLGNLNGSYTFDAPGFLTFNNVNLSIPIGNAVTITLTNVSLTPDQTVIASGNATVTLTLLTGMPSGTINGFQLMRTGFSISSFSVGTTAPISIGNYLTLAMSR